MWRLGWMFWMVPLFIWIMMMRRRPWGRRETMREPEGLQSHIDALETRMAQVEERLDFTERLLAGRQETSSRA